MHTLLDPVAAIKRELDDWEVAFVELDVFGTDDAATIAAMVDRFAREHLGARIDGYLFYASSVGSTHGLQLVDGRRVVLKVRPPPATNPHLPLDRDALAQVFTAQHRLATAGYPCPLPLLGPTPLVHGLATIEQYMADGERRDAHDPHVRGLLARSLAEHITLLDPLLPSIAPTHFAAPRDRLFPQPHSQLFQPSEPDTIWVRELGRRARDIAESIPSPRRIGHCDWRVEHVRFAGDCIAASYDWDSVAALPETRIVGVDAHGHTADWSQQEIRRVPTHEGILGFIDDYARARLTPFTADEHRGARAWAAYWIAYGAWISIAPGERDWPDDSWPALLRACGEALLRPDVARARGV